MNKAKSVLFLVTSVFFVLLLFGNPFSASAQSEGDKLEELNRQIQEYQSQLTRLNSQANTLSNQIAQFNTQIQLTELKIDQTIEKIHLLGGRIDQLEVSLSSLTRAFSSRVIETYKVKRMGDALFFMFSSDSLSEAVSRFHYLRKVQESDRQLLTRLQSAQNTYKVEKVGQEDLQNQLEDQNQVLGAQKVAKANLLEVTRNDEKRYQELLSKARAEIEAIQAIIAGKGEETEVGAIGEGQKIASIIPRSSTCSSGGHLHFEVAKDKVNRNPADHLIPKEVIWDNGPDSPFNFGGGWQWPLNDPVRITQGFGMTYYASQLGYYGGGPHTGIDMVNDNGDLTVKAARSGTLFRGAIGCGGGTLRYVRVKQDEGIDTYYLHVNYL